MASCSAGNI